MRLRKRLSLSGGFSYLYLTMLSVCAVFPLLWLLDLWCRALAGFSLKEADTRKALGSSSLPVLFLHGKEDKFVPVSMTEENYRACRGEKDLYLVPGAAHAQSYGTDTPGCQARIEKLLRR